MRYKVLGQYFNGNKREVLGRFEFGGTKRVKDDRSPEFLRAAMRASNVQDVCAIYAIIQDHDTNNGCTPLGIAPEGYVDTPTDIESTERKG